MRIWFFFNLHVSKGYSTRRLLTELTEFPDKGSRESARRVHLLGNQAAVWINARICTECHHTSQLLRSTFHVFPVGYLTFKLILNIYALLCSDVSVANHTPRCAHKIHGTKPVSSTKLHQSLWANSVYQTMEENVNKDTQAAGGTIGFSLKPGAVTTHYLTAEHRSMCLRQLRHLIGQGRS